MQQGGTRIFADKEKLAKMISLRKKGMSFPKIAKIFNCDHASIIYQWRKYILGKKAYETKKLKNVDTKVIIKEGHCPKCEMKLDSTYHLENPCKI